MLKDDKPEIVDAIGDMVVVLNKLSSSYKDIHIEYCIDEAYKVIAARTGKMINGTFVKERMKIKTEDKIVQNVLKKDGRT